MTSLPGLSYFRRRRMRGRWARFTDDELTELLVALDGVRQRAMQGYARPGSAEKVAALIEDIERHCVTGR